MDSDFSDTVRYIGLLEKDEEMAELTLRNLRIGKALHRGTQDVSGMRSPTAVRQGLMAVEDPVVIVGATGCFEVSTTVYPYSAWRVPYMHIAFEMLALGSPA